MIESTNSKKLMLFSGRGHTELADDVARELDTELTPTSLFDFANGEIFVRYEQSVRGSDAFVIQSHTTPVNTWIMEQLIMVDALKRASAKRITVVAPFYGYARQDKKHRGREPISARLMADLFKTAGANRLMAVNLALPSYEMVVKASHTFNLLDARRAISVTERQRYILRVRTLARAVAQAYFDSRLKLGFPLAPPALRDEVMAKAEAAKKESAQ